MDEIEQIQKLKYSQRSNRVRNSGESSKAKNQSLKEGSTAEEDEDESKETELENLHQLFQKILLLTQMDDIDSFREFFFNSQQILDKLYEDLQSKDKQFDEVLEFRETKRNELADLKKKKKTNQEYIDENKSGYKLAREVVRNRIRNDKLVDRDFENQQSIKRIEYFVDDVKKYTLINVDKFWEKRKIKMSQLEEEEAQGLKSENHAGDEIAEGSQGEEEQNEGEDRPVAQSDDNQKEQIGEQNDDGTNEISENDGNKEKSQENNENKPESQPENENSQQAPEQQNTNTENTPIEEDTESKSKPLENEPSDVQNPLFESQAVEPSATESEKHQEELEKIRQEEFKNEILEFRVKGKDIKDPDLKKLDQKIKTYKPNDEKVLDKVKWLEKLTEDLNLLTNFIRNKKVDAVQIRSLHKPIRKKEQNQDSINRDITETSYQCKDAYSLQTKLNFAILTDFH